VAPTSKAFTEEKDIEELEESSVQFQALERRIIEILKEAKGDGILQREIWKKLDLDSRKGLKLLRKLEAQGLIIREQVTYKGRKTYILKLAKIHEEVYLPEFLERIPCFYCPYLQKCASGERDIYSCPKLQEWLERDE
jgi:DNA-binding MarR family transcriptional regulator